MERFITIHGHFYQPPREDPWIETVELQDDAYPFHDWNERVTAECYAPNTASRILDADHTIIDIVNNFAKISFDFAPTFLKWMEKAQPLVYEAIVEADRVSKGSFGGHGAAIAACYNHVIMPLALRKDKQTQVLWGIEDFVHRFGRNPEGMWIPELAVDYETLDIMAENGIRFTILAPHQAKSVRRADGGAWREIEEEETLDIRMPYRCTLPGGKSIAVFFYNKRIAEEVAFGTLLENGERFADRLADAFTADAPAQLVTIATDGESYGHYHRFGDMALAYCLYRIEKNNLAAVTVYGHYLELHPPTHEIGLHERTSWSCKHGVERWIRDCGCAEKKRTPASWTREWRAPLRGVIDWVRDNCLQLYEDMAARYVNDPWKLRDGYIRIILDRSDKNVDAAISSRTSKAMAPGERVLLLKLCELQRYAQLMYTSSGWHSDDISGAETVQVLSHAARAMQLAAEISSLRLEDTFIKLCGRAKSNLARYGNGAGVYNQLVKPAIADLMRIAVHYAISSLFKRYPETAEMYCFTISRREYERNELGSRSFASGKACIRSGITGEEADVLFIVVHMGDHDIIAGLDTPDHEESFDRIKLEIRENFIRSDITECIRIIEEHFSGRYYTIWHQLKEEQRAIVLQVLSTHLREVEAYFRQTIDRFSPLLQAVQQVNAPIPRALHLMTSYIVNADLLTALNSGECELDGLKKNVFELRRFSLDVDRSALGFHASRAVTACVERLEKDPRNRRLIETANEMFHTLEPLSLETDVGVAQNKYFLISKRLFARMRSDAEKGDGMAQQWVEGFSRLGCYLNVKAG